VDAIGTLRLDQIKRVHVNRFIESRLKEEVSPQMSLDRMSVQAGSQNIGYDQS